MGGMCLGSLLLPRVVSARQHPLRVYALLELGIGVLALVILNVMPLVNHLYTSVVGHGLLGILMRGLVCVACLLPPTLLMGATLPAIARWVETTPQGVSWLGFFYGGNIVGAVFGCLFAGFYLLRVHDMPTATYVAAMINGAVALAGLFLANRTPHRAPAGDRTKERAAGAPGAWPVYVTIALSGMSALGAEVVWTRLLSLMLGGSVYTFSIILAVFLVGLGIGSSVGAVLARESRSPRLALGVCQMLLTVAIAWSATMIANSLPYWPIKPDISMSPWYTFQLDLARCCWAILPAAILWGASFPLALAAVAARGQDAGRLVGGVYAANTVGAILGALLFSVVVIGWWGTQQAERLLIDLAAVSALVMFTSLLWPAPAADAAGNASESALPLTGAAATVASVGLAAFLAWSVPETPWGLAAYGRNLPDRISRDTTGKMLFMGEGMNSSVAVTEMNNGVRNFHVSGKVEASSEPQDMRLQRMLAHVPALFHPKPRSVLIVGCGAGVTAGTFLVHPTVERIVICELEPVIPRVVAQYFSKENYHVVDGIDQQNPHVVNGKTVEVVYDDARHYVLTTRDKFDIITSDPIHPWVKGAATLYTKEYFELCKAHLNPGGLVTQWVPLYESNLDTVKSEVKTFFEVFPHGTIWSNDINGAGYDTVTLGQVEPMRINVDELQQRLQREDHAAVVKSILEVGFGSAIDLLATYAGQASDLGPWLQDAEVNRDLNLRLQYLAGMGLNAYKDAAIYNDMVVYRKFPAELFIGSPERKFMLRRVMMRSSDR
jgi:spermidine synthase